jgi:hypothetical protein
VDRYHANCDRCGRRLAEYLGGLHCPFCDPSGPPPASGPEPTPADEGPGVNLEVRQARNYRLCLVGHLPR